MWWISPSTITMTTAWPSYIVAHSFNSHQKCKEKHLQFLWCPKISMCIIRPFLKLCGILKTQINLNVMSFLFGYTCMVEIWSSIAVTKLKAWRIVKFCPKDMTELMKGHNDENMGIFVAFVSFPILQLQTLQ